MTEITLAGENPGLLSGEPSFSAASGGQTALRDRAFLLREINITRQDVLQEHETFLVVINIADTKRYDDIIRCFGYKFADDLITIRLADLTFINSRQPAYRVGFWSLGFIFRARSPHDYESTLTELITLLEKPLICRGIPVTIKAGVGVCDLKLGLGAAEDLVQATFLAGQEAAGSWRGWVECKYDLSDDHRRAFALISDAGQSLSARADFELSYQARIDIKSGRCIAAEALLRWYHPTLGLVMPNEFIPLIEMTGLIKELTIWVLTRAITQAAQWHLSGYAIHVCVNV
ncbi:MAG: EAL domain-containing protein, partial [Acidocella sp.]|nr:EAL domain-containing protein [Acidocella sp.]